MAEEKKNLFQRMSEITNELGYVAKNLTIEVNKKGDKYKAVSESDILSAVKPLETKHGIYSYPVEREIIETKEMTTKYGTVQQFLRLKVVYRFVNVDKTDEYLDIISYGDGVDSGDKAPGKAMTYADKYALMKAYKISTSDDPDKDPSENYKPTVQKSLTTKRVQLEADMIALGIDIKDAKIQKIINDNMSAFDMDNLDNSGVKQYNGILQQIINAKKKKLEKESLV